MNIFEITEITVSLARNIYEEFFDGENEINMYLDEIMKSANKDVDRIKFRNYLLEVLLAKKKMLVKHCKNNQE